MSDEDRIIRQSLIARIGELERDERLRAETIACVWREHAKDLRFVETHLGQPEAVLAFIKIRTEVADKAACTWASLAEES